MRTPPRSSSLFLSIQDHSRVSSKAGVGLVLAQGDWVGNVPETGWVGLVSVRTPPGTPDVPSSSSVLLSSLELSDTQVYEP